MVATPQIRTAVLYTFTVATLRLAGLMVVQEMIPKAAAAAQESVAAAAQQAEIPQPAWVATAES
ncbi:MAG: hypothetical protein FWD19_01000 [Defluviitaleaceae bacterium]|nr:hypothetical protein [Defluviitaleaceae bacterium]